MQLAANIGSECNAQDSASSTMSASSQTEQGKKKKTDMANPRQKDFEASRFHLIVTELDLAITFCKIASTTESEERAQRNLENARQAHDAALRLMHGVSVTSDMSKQIDERLEQLRPLLQRSWSS